MAKNLVSSNSVKVKTSGSDLYLDCNEYSSTEQIVGTWVDGKPIYRKVVVFNVEGNDNLSIPYNISNTDSVWINEGKSFVSSSLETLNLNWYYSSSEWCRTWINKTQGVIRFRCPAALGTRTCYAVLEYTKTTD